MQQIDPYSTSITNSDFFFKIVLVVLKPEYDRLLALVVYH